MTSMSPRRESCSWTDQRFAKGVGIRGLATERAKREPKITGPRTIQKCASDPAAPHIQGRTMNKHLDKIRPKMLQNKANSTVLGPYFCSYFCLVCGGLGFKKDSQPSGPAEGLCEFFDPISGLNFGR